MGKNLGAELDKKNRVVEDLVSYAIAEGVKRGFSRKETATIILQYLDEQKRLRRELLSCMTKGD